MKTELSTYEQTAIDFLAKTKTTLTTDFKEFNSMAWDKDGQKRNIFTVTIQNDRHKYSFDFGSSLADSLKKGGEKTNSIQRAETIIYPTAYDILSCITKYEVGTFENFCGDFGYDTDSRTAVKTYKAVRKEWNNISKLFTESEIEELQEIN